jgi:hypothetical protein
VDRLAAPLVAYLGRRGEQATWAGLKRFLEGREPNGLSEPSHLALGG